MIKKTFVMLLTGISMFSFAQETNVAKSTSAKESTSSSDKTEVADSSSFKPEAGNIAIDITAPNLFKLANAGSDFGKASGAGGFGGGIRVKYFLEPKLAVRVSLSYNLNKSNDFTPDLQLDPVNGADETDGISGSHKKTNGTFQIAVGAEKHLKGTKRLDTYIGAELLYRNVSRSESFQNVDVNNNINVGYRASVEGGFLNDKSVVAGNGLGLRLLVGADYYIFSKIYVGVELGIAGVQTWASDYKLVEVDPDKSVNRIVTISNRGNSFSVADDITAQLRIGFRL